MPEGILIIVGAVAVVNSLINLAAYMKVSLLNETVTGHISFCGKSMKEHGGRINRLESSHMNIKK